MGRPYGADRLVEGLDYASEICDALDAAGLDWLQFHPEYGASQFELSWPMPLPWRPPIAWFWLGW